MDFNYDRVLGENCSQADVYKSVSHVIQGIIEGFNGKEAKSLGVDGLSSHDGRSVDISFCISSHQRSSQVLFSRTGKPVQER